MDRPRTPQESPAKGRGLIAAFLAAAVVVALVGASVAWNQTRAEAHDALPVAQQHLVRNGVDLDIRCLPMSRVSEVEFVDSADPRSGFRYTCELVPGIVRASGLVECSDGRLRGPGFSEDNWGIGCDEASRPSPERLTSSLGASLSSGGLAVLVLAGLVAGPLMIARGVGMRARPRGVA